MQTKNLIQASTNVVKITRLEKGDVIKIVEDQYSSGPEIFFGVVIDLLNDGEKSFVQIMRYKKSYRAVDCDVKTYSGDKDCTLFPCTVEEVEEHLQDTIKSIRRDIESQERELDTKKLGLKRAEEFVSFETSKKLRATEFKEVTQQEYLALKEKAQANPF